MKKSKIKWPVYKDNKLVRDGTINGVSMNKIWEQCQKESEEYYFKHRQALKNRYVLK